jgi:hypothetical protein
MKALSVFGCAALTFASVACLSQPGGVAKAQEIANEANLNARFGRIEIAAEQVAPAFRAPFSKSHAAWGTKVRVVDSEMVGIRSVNESQTEADVAVRVNWFRPENQELRSTLLRQKWKSLSGDWKLVAEERADGDVGLLGERIEKVQAPSEEEARPAKFRTIKLTGQTDEE